MQIPRVTETRRAGQPPADAHRRQVELVTRSLAFVPDRYARGAWDEATRTQRPARAA